MHALSSSLITSFFLYTGAHNNAEGYPVVHNEIDIEFIRKPYDDTLYMQSNYFTNGDGDHEALHVERDMKPNPNPSRDVRDEMRWYGFKWSSTGISWYIDSVKVREATSNTPKIEDGPLKMFMNMWVSNFTNPAMLQWAGEYTHNEWRAANPPKALYNTIHFTRGEDCEM